MDWFKVVNDNYVADNYTKNQVKIFVVKNKITEEQYQTITGDAYVA